MILNVNHGTTASTEPIRSPPQPERKLSPHHRRQLVEGSGLTDETIRRAGIYSESNMTRQRMLLNWSGSGKDKFANDAIVFPALNADGTSEYSRLKFDIPRKRKNADGEREPVKYESPKGALQQAYFPPGVGEYAKEAEQEIVITEGEKKSLRLTQDGFPTIGLLGVWAFRPKGQKCLLPDLEAWTWNGRRVYVAFDSDVAEKLPVQKARAQLAALLIARGAVVRYVDFPAGPPDEEGKPAKCGADDFMVAAGADCKRRFRELLDNATEPEPLKGADERPNAKALDPAEEAAKIIAGMTEDEVCRLRFHKDDFHVWSKGRYVIALPSEIRAEVVGYLNQRCHHLTGGVTSNVLDQLKAQTLLPFGYSAPCWLKTIEGCGDWKAEDVISCRNGLLHLPTYADNPDDGLLPPSPRLFTPCALDFSFDPKAPPPARWLAFLGQLWQDQESIDLLQQWLGYCLTCDTRQQKMLWLVGPRRSGKSTITRVTSALVGESNVCSPTFGSLATEFGLQPLIAKTLAIIDDARLSGRTDQAIVTERLLQITGEGSPTINRKHQSQLTAKLLVRFMVTTNELPKLSDASGALSGRMLILKTTRTFYDQENINLTDELLQERPAILKWAIEGWARLQQRGRFIQPESGAQLRRKMDDLASPVSAFVRERCELGADFEVPKAALYQAYCGWSTAANIKPQTEPHFGRDLFAAFSEVDESRPRQNGSRVNCYSGLRLQAEFV